MDAKKGFKVYYLLVAEGTTEFNLFAYLTTSKFRNLFDESNVKFSNKVEIIKDGHQIIAQGKLHGAGSIGDFTAKYDLIKEKYEGQTIFFVLDKDLDDSAAIESLIKQRRDIAQFIEHNSEYLLLKFADNNPRIPSEFNTLKEFRDYCKAEFYKQFSKEGSELKDVDFDQIFSNATDEEIRNSFAELFATLS